MGSCVSKCGKRKRKHQVDFSYVQDKLVISQAPPPPPASSLSTKLPLYAHSPTSASSSVSSVSCTTRKTSNSCSLTSSLSSTSSISLSTVSSKERSFSNDFLYSCVKENPQIIRVDQVKGVLKKPVAGKNYSPDSIQPSRQFSSIPQKRARANSPVLSRQKSFRREIEISNYTNSYPSRNLRSPSPSRRFGGDHNYRGDLRSRHKEICFKNSVVAKENAVNSGILQVKRENIRPSSPSNNLGRNRGSLMNRENSIYGICSKIDEIAVGKEFSSKQDVDVIPMEDIDNPLIDLDCFIFL